ncbi:MAG: ABC transporter substrate-binding protein, partial [Oscillospiraceae bacterium]
MQKSGRFLTALVLVLGLLSGCVPAENPAASPTVSVTPSPTPTVAEFALPYDPAGGLNPLTTTVGTNLTMMPLLYEGLYGVNAQFEAEQVLCQSAAPNPEKTVWVFTVKSGITCSDGTAVTGELCKASLLAAKASPLYGQRLRNVTAIAADGQSLTISLSAPNENLPLLLDTPIFAANDGAAPAGTGPYVLKDGKLTARADWWQKKSVPQKNIPLFECATADELVYAFDAGNVGLVTADLTGTSVLGYSGNYEVAEFPTTGMLYVGFNTLSGPCQDVALRRTLTQGIDRATICASLLAGHATPAALPVHPDSGGYDEKLAS